jgi:hypothetical protein
MSAGDVAVVLDREVSFRFALDLNGAQQHLASPRRPVHARNRYTP